MNARRILAIAASLGALAPACSEPPQADDATPTVVANRCASDAECGAGVCDAGSCRAREGELDRVVLEIVPDSTSSFGAGLGFLLEAEGVAAGDARRDLALPALSSVRGRVRLTSPGTSCTYAVAADASIAARVDLTPTDALLGIPRQSYAATSTSSAPKPGAPEGWSFGATVVPGVYDVYVRPADDPACPVAPALLTSVPIAPGDLAMPLDLGEPADLAGTIVPPLAGTLDGWSVDVVDPVHGRTISTTARLGAGAPTNFRVQWRAPQATASAPGSLSVAGAAASMVSPLLRVTPPSGVAAPTALWDLAAADLDGDGAVSLDLSALPLAPVHVRGELRGGADAASVVPGVVSLASASLAGAIKGVTASHAVSVTTDANGAFEADLLPGVYKVVALPDPASPWGVAQTSWIVTATDAEMRRTVAAPPRTAVSGSTRGPSGAPLAGMTVSAVPSVAASPNAVLDQALAKASLLPRAAGDYTAGDGTFVLALDAGRFDLAVQAPERSGLPWAVAPHLDVAAAGPVDVALTASWPVPLGGHLVDPGGAPVANALVRAWAVLADGVVTGRNATPVPGAKSSAVQVGEARTDGAGRWRVLLPSHLGR